MGAIPFEKIVKQDLEIGYGTVARTMPNGGTATGDKIGLHTWLDRYNVKDFGAIGDAVADDTPAFLAAQAALPVNGGVIYAPDGNYRLATPLTVDIDNVTIEGNGYCTTLRPVGNTCGVLIGDSADVSRTKLRNLRIVPSPSTGSTGAGVVIGNASKYGAYVLLDRVHIEGFTGVGGAGVRLNYCQEVKIQDCFLYGNLSNIHFPATGSLWVTSVEVCGASGYVGGATGWGILLEGFADGFSVHHSILESNALGAFKSSGRYGTIEIAECYIEANGASGTEVINIDGGSDDLATRFRLTGNNFHQTLITKLRTDYVLASLVSGNKGLFEGTAPVVTTAHSEILFLQNRELHDDTLVTTYLSALAGKLAAIEAGKVWTNVEPANYADNAAAVAGGLKVGEWYRTTDTLKIVHA
jgi:hypothetical protein